MTRKRPITKRALNEAIEHAVFQPPELALGAIKVLTYIEPRTAMHPVALKWLHANTHLLEKFFIAANGNLWR